MTGLFQLLQQFHFDNFFRLELMRLADLERDGLIEDRMSPVIRVTPAGRIFVRAIAHAFDAYQAASVAWKAVQEESCRAAASGGLYDRY